MVRLYRHVYLDLCTSQSDHQCEHDLGLFKCNVAYNGGQVCEMGNLRSYIPFVHTRAQALYGMAGGHICVGGRVQATWLHDTSEKSEWHGVTAAYVGTILAKGKAPTLSVLPPHPLQWSLLPPCGQTCM